MAIVTPTETVPVVLVVRFSAIGDIVLSSGAVTALARAWPLAEIVYVTKQAHAPFIEHHPHVSRVVTLAPGESVFSLAARLRVLQPTAVLDLQDKLRSRVLLTLISARPVVWKKRRLKDELMVRLRRRPYHAWLHIAERYHMAVEEVVGRSIPRVGLSFFSSADQVERARRLLVSAGVDLSQPIVGMAPGAVWETKRWPSERFGHLAQRLLDAGRQVVVMGSAAERSIVDAVIAVAPGVVDLTGRLQLAELGAAISLCKAFVANDSGPMHIARALGSPTLAFFGSTDPNQFDFTGHALRFAGIECSPCSLYGLRRCPKKHFRCMLELDVDSAWTALQPLLDGQRRAPVLG